MAFCKNCGQPVGDTEKFCANCGTPVDAQPVQQAPLTGDADVQANKGISVLSYFGILLLIPLFARKTSEYCRYHVTQGFTLLAISLCHTILNLIFSAIAAAIFPPTLKVGILTYYYAPSAASIIVGVIGWIITIAICVFSIIGIVNAATGKKKELPLVGQIKILDPVVDKIYEALNK